MKRLLTLFLLITAGMQAAAQNDRKWDENFINTLKQDGRIYIVIAVVAIILIGLFLYMWRLDRKITRMEQQIHK